MSRKREGLHAGYLGLPWPLLCRSPSARILAQHLPTLVGPAAWPRLTPGRQPYRPKPRYFLQPVPAGGSPSRRRMRLVALRLSSQLMGSTDSSFAASAIAEAYP